jgi:hypothetical protein
MRSVFYLALSVVVLVVVQGWAAASNATEVRGPQVASARPFGLPRQWKDAVLGQGVVKGAARGDTLWLLGWSGAVVEFDLKQSRRRTLKTGVRDVLLDGSHLWAVSAAGGRSSWMVEDLLGEGSPESVRASGEVVGLFKSGTGLGVLAQESVSFRGAKWWDTRDLKAPLKAGALAYGATADGLLYVGSNRGEWGGELVVIDPASGVAEELSQENVTAIVSDPVSPACVLATSGLAHLGISSGRVLRVCGREGPTDVFRADMPAKATGGPSRGTWALEDLVAAGQRWTAVSNKRLFVSQNGRTREAAMPPLTERNGIWINDEDPEVIVVLRSCCWGSVDNPMDYGVILVPKTRP